MPDESQPTNHDDELTPEEILELFGAPAPEIVRTPEDQAELEWIMRYVEEHGHQP